MSEKCHFTQQYVDLESTSCQLLIWCIYRSTTICMFQNTALCLHTVGSVGYWAVKLLKICLFTVPCLVIPSQGMVVQQVVLPPYSSMVPSLIVSSGYCLVAFLCMFSPFLHHLVVSSHHQNNHRNRIKQLLKINSLINLCDTVCLGKNASEPKKS